jgi:hypothetical protein
MNKFIKLNIQLFAEPKKDELDDLLKDIEEPKKTEPIVEATKTDPVPGETKKETIVEPTKTDPVPGETKKEPEKTEEESLNEEEKKKGGIKALREAHEAEKKKAKELEEQKNKLETDTKTTKEKLIKAIKLGIKGETEEEILQNLSDYEVKEEATKTGLTEEQVRKEKDLQERMKKLNDQEQEILFNRRAYNLQKTKNLTEEQIMAFIEKAGKIGINLLTNPTPFEEIYDSVIIAPKLNESEKDKKIRELSEEITRLKNIQAPGKTVDGVVVQIDPNSKDWEAELSKMDGKK